MEGWGGQKFRIPKKLISKQYEFTDFGRKMAEKLEFKSNFSLNYD